MFRRSFLKAILLGAAGLGALRAQGAVEIVNQVPSTESIYSVLEKDMQAAIAEMDKMFWESMYVYPSREKYKVDHATWLAIDKGV